MGYYSWFDSDAYVYESGKPLAEMQHLNELPFVEAWIRENLEEEFEYTGFEESHGETKWYEWEEDLTRLSAAFPGVLFVVDREGEENGDMERGWFLNGNAVTIPAEVRFPLPDFRYLETGEEDA